MTWVEAIVERGPFGLWGAMGTLYVSARLAILPQLTDASASCYVGHKDVGGMQLKASVSHKTAVQSLADAHGQRILARISAIASGNSGGAGSSYRMQLKFSFESRCAISIAVGALRNAWVSMAIGTLLPTAAATALTISTARSFCSSVRPGFSLRFSPYQKWTCAKGSSFKPVKPCATVYELVERNLLGRDDPL